MTEQYRGFGFDPPPIQLWFAFHCAWSKDRVRLQAKVRPGMTADSVAEDMVKRACDWFAADPRFLRVEGEQ